MLDNSLNSLKKNSRQMNQTRPRRESRLTVEFEALEAGPVAVDGAAAAAATPPDPPTGRRPAAARRRGRRPGRRAAQLVHVLPAAHRGRVPALEGRPEQPVHLSTAAPGRRQRRAGLELERRRRQQLRWVARHGERAGQGVLGGFFGYVVRGKRTERRCTGLYIIYTKWKGIKMSFGLV
jgi:hypothetical protein